MSLIRGAFFNTCLPSLDCITQAVPDRLVRAGPGTRPRSPVQTTTVFQARNTHEKPDRLPTCAYMYTLADRVWIHAGLYLADNLADEGLKATEHLHDQDTASVTRQQQTQQTQDRGLTASAHVASHAN